MSMWVVHYLILVFFESLSGVQVSDNFNVTLAQTTKGTESSRAASSSTRSTKTSTGGPSGTGASASSSVNVPAIVGGVVGGVVGLGLIGGLIAFLIVQRKKASSKSYQPGFQPQNMTYTPNTTASLVATTTSPGPGSPGRVYVSSNFVLSTAVGS